MASQPDDTDPAQVPVRRSRYWSVFLGMATGLVFRLLFRGDPDEALNVMMASFVLLVPVAIGAITVFAAERVARRSWSFYFLSAAAANSLFVIGTFVVLIEGLICTVLAVPLFATVGGLAGLVTGAVCRWSRHANSTVVCVTALPLVLGSLEQHVPLTDQVDTITVSRLVRAPPRQVWHVIREASDIRPEEMNSAWMYRIGVPLPLSARTRIQNGERIRHIEMNKGIAFDQPIVDWEPERRVRYEYRFTETSFPPRALDDHVLIGGEFFDLIDTEYTLDPTYDGTRLTARMSYRVSTHFNWYARLVARVLVRNFETTALAFYARRAEASNAD